MKLSTRNVHRFVDNILSTYYASTENERQEGRDWYDRAHNVARTLADRYDTDIDTVAAVLSALSPLNEWTTNVDDAERYLAAAAAGLDRPKASTYGQNQDKAWSIATGELAPRDAWKHPAMKTTHFFELIADPAAVSDDPNAPEGSRLEACVTIDGHAACIAVGQRDTLADAPDVNIGAYRVLCRAYREAADKVGIPAHAMQATTWLTWRRLHVAPQHTDRRDIPWL